MRLKSMFDFAVRLAFAVAVVCCIASMGRAQTYEGKFTLPLDAQWENATLPAGDYSFRLVRPDLLDPIQVAVIRVRSTADETLQFAAPAIGRPEGQALQHSSLVLLRNGGKYIVRDMFIKELGLTFHYPLPKSAGPLITKGPVLIQRLPSLMAAK